VVDPVVLATNHQNQRDIERIPKNMYRRTLGVVQRDWTEWTRGRRNQLDPGRRHDGWWYRPII